ncbi:MAG: monovalent cation/H+ antiporter subunit D [Pseudomonadota bacterium]
MNHWVIAPIILPALVAPVLIMIVRHHLDLQRIFTVTSSVALAVISVALLWTSASGQIEVYELGNWPAPFGIVLVLDRLSAMMVALTAFLSLGVLLYAIGSGWDRRGRHFHPLFLFQIMGINGAFLTGDAFNLFVFFEVLLIASYGLMIHGGGATRLRAGIQYVVYNLLGSTLFLFALGTIYAVTGTLNMADLAVKVAELPEADAALIRVGAVLLLLVFCVKAAVLPLHFWLPASYANAPAPVAALFAVMTKIGAYSILRIYTLVFAPDLAVTAGLIDQVLMPAALLTLAIGAIGMLGAREIGRLTAFAAIGSMGTLLIAIALFTPEATGAALYYTVHSTFATAALFLVVDATVERRGTAAGHVVPAPAFAQQGLIAALFFAAAIAIAGMPPLSGYLGKLLVLDAARDHAQATLVWAVVLGGSLVMILGLARAGSTVFWKTAAADGAEPGPDGRAVAPPGTAIPGTAVPATATPGAMPGAATPGAIPDRALPGTALSVSAIFAILAPLVLITVLAGPFSAFTAATAEQLYAPQGYIEAVLGPQPAQPPQED